MIFISRRIEATSRVGSDFTVWSRVRAWHLDVERIIESESAYADLRLKEWEYRLVGDFTRYVQA